MSILVWHVNARNIVGSPSDGSQGTRGTKERGGKRGERIRMYLGDKREEFLCAEKRRGKKHSPSRHGAMNRPFDALGRIFLRVQESAYRQPEG